MVAPSESCATANPVDVAVNGIDTAVFGRTADVRVPKAACSGHEGDAGQPPIVAASRLPAVNGRVTATVPRNGTCRLGVFYGTEGSVGRQALYVDNAHRQDLTFPATLNWQYRGRLGTPLALTAGTHRISLRTGGTGGPSAPAALRSPHALTLSPGGKATTWVSAEERRHHLRRPGDAPTCRANALLPVDHSHRRCDEHRPAPVPEGEQIALIRLLTRRRHGAKAGRRWLRAPPSRHGCPDPASPRRFGDTDLAQPHLRATANDGRVANAWWNVERNDDTLREHGARAPRRPW